MVYLVHDILLLLLLGGKGSTSLIKACDVKEEKEAP
jgi:hypothetical protein